MWSDVGSVPRRRARRNGRSLRSGTAAAATSFSSRALGGGRRAPPTLALLARRRTSAPVRARCGFHDASTSRCCCCCCERGGWWRCSWWHRRRRAGSSKSRAEATVLGGRGVLRWCDRAAYSTRWRRRRGAAHAARCPVGARDALVFHRRRRVGRSFALDAPYSTDAALHPSRTSKLWG